MSEAIKSILKRAKSCQKGNYLIYTQLKKEIYAATDDVEEAQKAVMKLIRILEV